MMERIKAIETFYNGYRFRSRAEARWAVLFDEAGIRYQYEPEGLVLSDGTRYLPDFYLPDSDTYFEVKGLLDDEDAHKVDQLATDTGKNVVIGYANMEFQCRAWYGDGEGWATKGETVLCKCRKCGKYWFMDETGIWDCKCCGAYDGNHLFTAMICGEEGWRTRETWEPLVKAKQARFEHGERPATCP